MSIRFACGHCRKVITVPDHYAGKRGKCPGCQKVVAIPALATAGKSAGDQREGSSSVLDDDHHDDNHSALGSESRTRSAGMSGILKQGPARASQSFHQLTKEELSKQILGSFQGEIPPAKSSLVQKLGLFTLALLCLSIAAIPWLTLGAAIGASAWWMITTGAVIGPIVVAGLALAIFARPLASHKPRARTLSIPRGSDPLLWQLIDQVAAAIHAPQPKQLEVDCSLEANSRGPSIVSRNVILTFGLPLAGTCTITQLVGVLSRELGRYQTGTAFGCIATMRWTYEWLARLAHKPDATDQWLSRKSKTMNLVFLPVKLLHAVARGYLKLLFAMIHLVAGRSLEQAEIAADRCQAELVGSQGYASTCNKLRLLNFAWNGVQADIPMLFSEKQLPENFVAAIVANLKQTPGEVREVILQQAAATARAYYDPCPSERDRIAAVNNLSQSGVFHCSFPAAILFDDFAKTSKKLTWEYYRARYGNRVRQHELRATHHD